MAFFSTYNLKKRRPETRALKLIAIQLQSILQSVVYYYNFNVIAFSKYSLKKSLHALKAFTIVLPGAKQATFQTVYATFLAGLVTMQGFYVTLLSKIVHARSVYVTFQRQLITLQQFYVHLQPKHATIQAVLVLFQRWHVTFQQFHTTFHYFLSLLKKFLYSSVSYILPPISSNSLYYKWFIQIRFSLLQTRAAWNSFVLRHQTDMLGSRFLLQGLSLRSKSLATPNCLIKPTIFLLIIVIQ